MLEENQLISIPVALQNTDSVEFLNLTLNDITEITTRAFGDNPSLKYLRLDRLNNLSIIGDCAFCGLTRLEASFEIKLVYINIL